MKLKLDRQQEFVWVGTARAPTVSMQFLLATTAARSSGSQRTCARSLRPLRWQVNGLLGAPDCQLSIR